MRLGIIGYGAVAAVHARQLKLAGMVLSTVCGPDRAKAESFAASHGFEAAETRLESAIEGCDAVVIASPSPMHFEQGMRALARRVPALIELPACASLHEANALATSAAAAGVVVGCAHTSRYLEPYRQLGTWIAEGRLGAIQQVHYLRCILPRVRTWTDDALLHHAAHPLDLFLHWFGRVEQRCCVGMPRVSEPQDISLLAGIPGGGPATITISYTARLGSVRMTIVGSDHTVATDGFSFLQSDDAELEWQGDGQAAYENAIRHQDVEFLASCKGEMVGVPWKETLNLAGYIEQFRDIWLQAGPVS